MTRAVAYLSDASGLAAAGEGPRQGRPASPAGNGRKPRRTCSWLPVLGPCNVGGMRVGLRHAEMGPSLHLCVEALSPAPG